MTQEQDAPQDTETKPNTKQFMGHIITLEPDWQFSVVGPEFDTTRTRSERTPTTMPKQIYAVQIGYDYYEIDINEITPLLNATKSLKKLKYNPDYGSFAYADVLESPISEIRLRTLDTNWQPPPTEEKAADIKALAEVDESEAAAPASR